MDTLLLREFLRDPTGIAAVTPSSAATASVLSVSIPESGEVVVVELGAGTGACTSVIQHRLGGRGRHIAVEVNPTLAELLTKRFPNAEVVCGEAEDLPKFLVGSGYTIRGRDHQHTTVGRLRPVGDTAAAAGDSRRVSGQRGRLYPGCVYLDAVGARGPSTTAAASGQLRRGCDQRDDLAQFSPCSRLRRQTPQERSETQLITAAPPPI